MSPIELATIMAAGFAAGGVNAVVGSGSLISFPTLVALGFPPVIANVTNNVGVLGGSITSTIGYRAELRGQLRRCLLFGVATTLGAVVGALLLLRLPGSVFETVVPALILFACTLLAANRWLAARLVGVRARHLGMVGWIGVFLTGIYGGYFGAAQGVILVALLALVLDEDLQRINGLKNVLAGLGNLVSALLFVVIADIHWGVAGLIAAGSIVGGHVGARYGRRIPSEFLRWTVVGVGVVVAVYMLFD